MKSYLKFVGVFGTFCLLATCQGYADSGDVVDPSAVPHDSVTQSNVNSPTDLQKPDFTGKRSDLNKAGLYSVAGQLLIDRYVNINTLTVSSLTASNVYSSTLTINNNQAYVLLYSSTIYETNGATATTSGTFVPTNTSIVITPHATTSRVEVTATGRLRTASGSASNAYATIERNATNLAPGSNPLCDLGGGAASVYIGPCAMSVIDSPGTTSAVTYKVYMQSSSAGTTTTWSATGEATTMTVKEYSY